jgi:hypothetical protein
MLPAPKKATAEEFECFAFRLQDIDDLGLFCSVDVREEARRLLGMPPHPNLIPPKKQPTTVEAA